MPEGVWWAAAFPAAWLSHSAADPFDARLAAVWTDRPPGAGARGEYGGPGVLGRPVAVEGHGDQVCGGGRELASAELTVGLR